MKLKDILKESNNDVIGPFKVKSYDDETRIMQLVGHSDVTLDSSIKDKPTVGYNQSFQLKDDGTTASELINQTADLIVYTDTKVLLIQRGNGPKEPFPNSWAIPGGFVDPGEKPIDAARRELKEETKITMNKPLRFVGLFNKPGRDPRRKFVWSYVYAVKVDEELAAKGSDDAQQAKWIDIRDAMSMNLAFDHKEILHHADIYKP